MSGRGQLVGIVVAAATAFAVSSAVVVLGRDDGPVKPSAATTTHREQSSEAGAKTDQPLAETATPTETPAPVTDPTKIPPDGALSPDDIAQLPTPSGIVVSPIDSPLSGDALASCRSAACRKVLH